MAETMRGRVYRIERDKGFAFCRDPKGFGRFLSANDFVAEIDFDLLQIGDEVEFIPFNNGKKGNGLLGRDIKRCLP